MEFVKFCFSDLRIEQVLSSYVKALSRLSGCLQFMQAALVKENDDESDEEDMAHHLYKAAEQDVPLVIVKICKN